MSDENLTLDDDFDEDFDAGDEGPIYFTIESQTKYMVDIKQVVNLEDVSDIFYTEDELREMFGLKEVWDYKFLLTKNITDALVALKDRIPEGKRSITIDDAELLEFFLTNPVYTPAFFIPGLRRTGNKLQVYGMGVNGKPEWVTKPKPVKQDFDRLTYWCSKYLSNRIGDNVNVSIKYGSRNYEGTINFLKSVIKWDDLIAYLNEVFEQGSGSNEDYLIRFQTFSKMFWDNPVVLSK